MEKTQNLNRRQAVYNERSRVNRNEYMHGSTAPDIRRELEEAPRRRVNTNARKNRDKASYMNLPYVLFLVLAVGVAVIVLSGYIKANAQVVRSVGEIAALEKEYLNLKADNDEEYSRIINSIDLEEMKRIAQEELGMHYANEGQIITYTNDLSDYVRQYSDID